MDLDIMDYRYQNMNFLKLIKIFSLLFYQLYTSGFQKLQ
jgi:hypothetical protein